MAINMTDIIGEAYNQFFKNKTLLLIGIVGAALYFVLNYMLTTLLFGGLITSLISHIRDPSAALALIETPIVLIKFIAMIVFMGIVSIFISGTVISAAADGDKATIGSAVRKTASRFLPLVGTAVISTAIMLLVLLPVGLAFLFFVYGLMVYAMICFFACFVLTLVLCYVMVRLSLANVICVVGGKDPMASVKGSWVMLKGSFWKIWVITFVISLFAGIVGMVLGIFSSALSSLVGTLLAYPTTVAMVLIYLQLVSKPDETAPNKPTPN
jgi:hypothetical protein